MATIETRMSKAFGLDDAGWSRHANPWSVYTRIPVPPLLAGAVWTREWIGWWCLIPVAIVVVWTKMNPTAFPPPANLDAWASRSVLGETFWSDRKNTPIPERHRRAPIVLIILNTIGLPFIVWGLVVADPWILALGLVVQSTGKLWFIDRMVWLYDDMTALGHVAPPLAEH
jgi:hypothetical protein